MKLRHFVLPHPQTHKKAHLISHYAYIIYIGIFVVLQVGFHFMDQSHPGILGIASNVNQQTLIQLTNQERAQYGLNPLKENAELDAAASAKAQNMFAENYWAHFAPSGKSPWDFIKGAGYQFSYAGENLARNFQNSNDVMVAWMNSPSHKENIINPHYQDIGMAVVNGTLLGEQTTLVVQEFGSPVGAAPLPAAPAQKTQQAENPAPVAQNPQGVEVPQNVASAENSTSSQPLINPFQINRVLGLVLIAMMIVLMLLDWLVLSRRQVYHLAGRHISHLMILILAAGVLITMVPGVIK